MLLAAQRTFPVNKGTDTYFGLLVELDCVPEPLSTGTVLWMAAKSNPADDDSTAIFLASTENGGITIPDPTQNFALIHIIPANTAAAATGCYFWAVKIQRPNGDEHILDEGILTLRQPPVQAS